MIPNFTPPSVKPSHADTGLDLVSGFGHWDRGWLDASKGLKSAACTFQQSLLQPCFYHEYMPRLACWRTWGPVEHSHPRPAGCRLPTEGWLARPIWAWPHQQNPTPPTLPANSWEIINDGWFKPLSFGMSCYSAPSLTSLWIQSWSMLNVKFLS